jgi:hypothetical protein
MRGKLALLPKGDLRWPITFRGVDNGQLRPNKLLEALVPKIERITAKEGRF